MDEFMDTPVGHDDFNRFNDIAIFKGPVETLYEPITKEELKALIDSGKGFTLLDAAHGERYARAHICGAVNIPVDFIERDALALDRFGLVVVYSHGKNSLESSVAVDKLYTLGFKRVVRYVGGLEEWQKAGLCVKSSGGAEAGTPKPPFEPPIGPPAGSKDAA